MLDVAVLYLEGLGYRTLAAKDGKQALALLGDHRDIDLLFCDIIMPGELDGYQVARMGHENRPALKALLTSGFTNKRNAHGDDESGFMSSLTRQILSKPYNDVELAFAVRRALDGDSG